MINCYIKKTHQHQRLQIYPIMFVYILFSSAAHLNNLANMSSASRLSEPLVLDGVVATVAAIVVTVI